MASFRLGLCTSQTCGEESSRRLPVAVARRRQQDDGYLMSVLERLPDSTQTSRHFSVKLWTYVIQQISTMVRQLAHGEETMSPFSNAPSRRVMLGAIAALPTLPGVFGAVIARAQTSLTSNSAGSGFSFAVYGDSRSMMYLPYKADQEAEAREFMVDIFDLVLPENVAKEVMQRDVKLIYDPETRELVQIVMPFMTRSEVTTLTVDQGWVTEASVEDVKLLPGVRRTMFRLQGG